MSLQEIPWESVVVGGEDDEIAAGAYGVVSKGTYGGSVCAVKTLNMQLVEGSKEAVIEAAMGEARVQAGLSASGHTVPLIGFCRKGQKFRLVMPLGSPAYPGSTEYSLQGAVLLASGYTVGQRLQFALEAAQAVAAVHSGSVVHCDIKPSNFVLFQQGGALHPRLGDFGQSRLGQLSGSRLTARGWGTMQWSPPEALQSKAGTAGSDVWSLALVVYSLATGLASPWAGLWTGGDFGYWCMDSVVQRGVRPAINQLPVCLQRGGAGEGVGVLLLECWRLNPAERPQAERLVAALQAALAGIAAGSLAQQPGAGAAGVAGMAAPLAQGIAAVPMAQGGAALPEQAQGYAAGYAPQPPLQAQGHAAAMPQQVQGYPYAAPQQAQGYPSAAPQQAQGYPSAVPQQAQGYYPGAQPQVQQQQQQQQAVPWGGGWDLPPPPVSAFSGSRASAPPLSQQPQQLQHPAQPPYQPYPAPTYQQPYQPQAPVFYPPPQFHQPLPPQPPYAPAYQPPPPPLASPPPAPTAPAQGGYAYASAPLAGGGSARPASKGLSAAEALKQMQMQHEDRGASASQAQAVSLDLAFCMDCTFSMRPYIETCKSKVVEIVAAIRAKFPTSTVRVAFVGYRDYDHGSKHFAVHDFSTPEAVEAFLRSGQVEPIGGTTTAEDVAGGLKGLLGLTWAKNVARMAVFFADAPAHGRQYHDMVGERDDDRLDIGPDERLEPHMEALAKRFIDFYAFKLTEDTNKMFPLMEAAYNGCAKAKNPFKVSWALACQAPPSPFPLTSLYPLHGSHSSSLTLVLRPLLP
jgi:hypothetical protein